MSFRLLSPPGISIELIATGVSRLMGLMIVLGRIERRHGNNPGDDGLFEGFGLIKGAS